MALSRIRSVCGVIITLACLISMTVPAMTQEPPIPPPGNLTAADTPNDDGSSIMLNWELSPGETTGIVKEYVLERAEAPSGPFARIGRVDAGTDSYTDQKTASTGSPDDPPEFKRGRDYYYRVTAVALVNGRQAVSNQTGPVSAESQWFHSGKVPVLVSSILFFVLVLGFIQVARTGREMYVRPIAGMGEIDNAIGRATEMGRPILYILGLGTPDDIATIASYTILARVAKKTAEYRTQLIVPCNEPIVMTIAQEIVRNAYLEAGHPDEYSDEMVFFVTSMQFAYVAAVNGIILRERTATNCYFGKFYAESLLLSETGNIAGSIQVAGTDEVAQLPFFITTCDYTLIGEELYAASAYLGRDPLLLGSLKAQDLAKAIVMILIVLGTILISFDIDWIISLIRVTL